MKIEVLKLMGVLRAGAVIVLGGLIAFQSTGLMASEIDSEKNNLELTDKLELAYKSIVEYDQITDKTESQKNQIKTLMTLARSERKKICYKLMKSFGVSNPKLAYFAADCLLYNGYGKLAIPFFTEFSTNGNNKKFMNGRMGYEWLHAGDIYEVGGDVLYEMTEGKNFYAWISHGIQDETLNNFEQYNELNSDFVSSILKQIFREEVKLNPMSDEQKNTVKNCQKIMVHIRDFTCEIDHKNRKKYKNCVRDEASTNKLIECGSAGN